MTIKNGEKGISLAQMARVMSECLANLPVTRRFEAPLDLFGDRLVLTSSFGPTSAALLHLVCQLREGVSVINIQHGHETPETLMFIEQCRSLFPIDLKVIRGPHLAVPKIRDSQGFKLFQQETKIKPLRRALKESGAWFWASGVMHDETDRRKRMAMARVRHGVVAIYPVLDWTQEQALQYCLENDLPINNNYFDPCKGPDQSLECGLHYDQGNNPARS